MAQLDLAPPTLLQLICQARIRLAHAAIGWGIVALIATIVAAGRAQAQNIVQGPNQPVQNRPAVRGSANTVMFREDRNVNRSIDKAREAIEAGNYDEAVYILGDVLQNGEDFFYRRDGGANLVSVKAEVRRLLGNLPTEGRKQLEVRYGTEARRRLQQALEAGDWRQLADVSAKFFHTAAGYEATWLLALHHRDRGEPLAAAQTLRQLNDASADVKAKFQPALSLVAAACWYQAGMESLAAQELATLKALYPNAQIQLGDRLVSIVPTGQDPLDWLASLIKQAKPSELPQEQWLVHRGNPHRNPALPFNSPVAATVWRAPAYDDFVDVGGELGETYTERGVGDALREVEQLAAGYGEALLPSAHPIVAGDAVIFRTATQLIAVDASSGKRRWTAAIDQNLQERLQNMQEAEGGARASDGQPAPGVVMPRKVPGQIDPEAVQLASALLTRVVADATYGTLSSDGQQVFVIEGLGLGGMHPQYRNLGGANRSRTPYNTLRGYDIATGKLMWELGGEPGKQQLELAGHWFLGPPLPLGGLLYVMVEQDDEIRLVCLDPYVADGRRVQWSQSLCVMEQNFVGEQTRRAAGVSPAFADGVLVCATASGAVVAVDPASRSLLWAFQYPAELTPEVRNCWLIPTTGSYYSTPGWSDAIATIHRGCLILTPPGSGKLHGLRLLDGAPLWEPIERADAVYVGGGYDDRIVLVGNTFVRAIHLDSGRTLWQTSFPGERVMAGRGYLAGDCYVVPLVDGTLAQVRLDDGAITLRPLGGSVDEERHAGNLIAVGDRVYCQHLYGCDSYLMVSAESLQRRLQTNPNDAEAWLIQGDMQLQQGQLDQAAESLRRAKALGAEKARPLLAECLLRQLKADFTQHESLRAELEDLVDRGNRAARYWQLVGEGLTAQGKRVEAVQAYLRLVEIAVAGDGRQPSGHIKDAEPGLSVRLDRLVAARLQRLWSDATPDERQAIDPIIQAKVEGELAAEQPPEADVAADAQLASLRQAIAYFGWHPSAVPLKWQLVEKLRTPRDCPLVEVEHLLLEILDSPRQEDQAAALAMLAEMFADADLWDAASWYIGQLNTRFADQVLPDGKTGAEVVEALLRLPDAPPAAKPWPTGRVGVRDVPPRLAQSPRIAISDAPPLPQFGDTLIQIENSLQLVARALDRDLWNVPFRHPVMGHPIAISSHGHRLAAHGRLLVFSTGCYLLGINTAGSLRHGPIEIRWVQPLIDQFVSGSAGPMFALPHWEATPWGTRRVTLRSAHSDPLGSLQPVVGRQVTFVRGRQLVSLDVLTGEPVWVRDNVPEASEVFGDDECIYLVPPDRSVAQVYRTVDGAALPSQGVPPWSQVMRALGRKLLVWQGDGQQVTVRLFDVATQQDVWTRSYDHSAKANFADDGRLGVLQRDGKFQLIDVASGKALIDATVDAIDPLGAIFILRHHDRYVLAATHAASAEAQQHNGWVVRPLQSAGGMQMPTINGAMHGFDEQGRLVWSQPVRHLSLPLDQPSASPVIGLMSHLYGITSQRIVRTGLGLVLVDKRTGRVIHRTMQDGMPGAYLQHVDREGQVIEFRTNLSTVRMEWTDEAWPDGARQEPIEPKIPEPRRRPPGNAPGPNAEPQRQPNRPNR